MARALPIDPKIKKSTDSRIDPKAKERKDIRYFGGSFIVILGAISLIALWRAPESWLSWLWVPALVIGVPSLAYPPCMKYVFKAWMFLGSIIGWIMSRILFSVFFYIMIAPMGLFMRLFGRDHMNLKFPTDSESNWTEVKDSANDPKHFEHMF